MSENDQSTKEFLHSLHPVMDAGRVFSQTTEMHLKKIPCCTLLVDNNDSNRMIKLNDTALIIWQLCTENRSVGDIVGLLSEAFEQDPDDMGRDVSRVLEHLLEDGAVIEQG
jgi:predicted transcriptional regulator